MSLPTPAWPHVVAAILPAALLVPMMARDGIPEACDPMTQAYPYHALLATSVANGTLPLFNPYQMGGTSFVGNVQASILYPPRLALAAVGPRGFVALLAMHLALAGLSASLLAARLGMGPAGCLVTAAAWAWGGFLVGKLLLPPVLLTASLLPLLLASVESVVQGRSRGRGLAGILALVLVSGHPQTALGVTACSAAYAAMRCSPVTLRLSGPWGARITALGLLASGAYVTGALSPEDTASWASPSRPYAWITLLVAALGLAARRGGLELARRPAPTRAAGALLGGAILGGVLCLGQLLPVVEHLSRSRPPSMPRAPEDFTGIDDRSALALDTLLGDRASAEEGLFLGPLPIVLAALALAGPPRPGRMALALLGMAGYVVAAAPAALRALLVEVPVVNLFGGLPRYLLVPALALAVLAGMGADLVARRRPLAGLALSVLVATHLVWGARPFLTSTPRPALHAGPALAADPPAGPFRYFTLDEDPPTFGLHFRRRELAGLLFPNLGTVVGWEDLQGYDPVHGWPITMLEEAVHAWGDWPGRDRYHFVVMQPVRGRRKSPEALLRLAGARYAFAHPRARAPRDFVLVRSTREGRLYELPSALPRAFRPERLAHEADPRRALARLATVDPSRDAFVDDPRFAVPIPAPPVTPLEIVRPSPGRLVVRGALGELLVVTELHDPAWRALVDGSVVAVSRADGIFLGIPARGGSELRLAYLPSGLRVGLFASLVGLGFVASGVARGLTCAPRPPGRKP